ncbi:13492_t:CDS:2, partial [Acaulospora morrowiae]
MDKEKYRFTGDNAIDEPLPAEHCRQLLQLINSSKELATRAINAKNKQEEITQAIQEGVIQDIDN